MKLAETMTDRGRRLVRDLQAARFPMEVRAITEEIGRLVVSSITDGAAGLSAGDRFALDILVARRIPATAEWRAALYDGAGTTAMIAGAYREALAAYQEAEKLSPEKTRRVRMGQLARLLEGGAVGSGDVGPGVSRHAVEAPEAVASARRPPGRAATASASVTSGGARRRGSGAGAAPRSRSARRAR